MGSIEATRKKIEQTIGCTSTQTGRVGEYNLSGEKKIIVYYPIYSKGDEEQKYIDPTYGEKEREEAWQNAINNNNKIFILATYDFDDAKNILKDYILSIEIPEENLKKYSDKKLTIPQEAIDSIGSNKFYRHHIDGGYIAFIEKSGLTTYLLAFDNRPYMTIDSINYDVFTDIEMPYNRIIVGAPGTGKSNKLEQECQDYFGTYYERVTFHANYAYSNFMGSYKPTIDKENGGLLTYRYVPGPFMRMWVKAYKSMQRNEKFNHLLIIEEINRANTAAVFGDIFQLLDRQNGESTYSIITTEEIRCYLDDEFKEESWYKILCEEDKKRHTNSIKLYSNIYIWCTMNTADQGVYPMDTAFKRRWDFEYLDIDSNENFIDRHVVTLASVNTQGGKKVHWNTLRKEINKRLIEIIKVHEDKLIGAFFLGEECFKDDKEFNKCFKNKLLLYLYEDVTKYKRSEFFSCECGTFIQVCKAFDKKGDHIFGLNLEDIVVDDIKSN